MLITVRTAVAAVARSLVSHTMSKGPNVQLSFCEHVGIYLTPDTSDGPV